MTPSPLRVATAANPPGTARATPREYEFRSTSAVAAHEQRNRRSSGKVLNLKIVLDWVSGAISPMAKCWTTKAGHATCGPTARHCLRISVKASRQRAHQKGLIRIRGFSGRTTAAQPRSRQRCWREGGNRAAQIKLTQRKGATLA